MGSVRPWHIAVLVVLLILLFGAKRLPDAARSLGRSMRIIKAETKGLADDDVDAKAEAQSGRAPLTGQIDDDRPSAKPVVDPTDRVREQR
jgi:sec-independent protein translocase protein TatA